MSEFTSQFHASSSLQQRGVCLPLCVQELTYRDDEFYENMDDSDNSGGDNVGDDGDQVMGINSGDSPVVFMATSSQFRHNVTLVRNCIIEHVAWRVEG